MRHRITITLLLGSLCNVLSASAQPIDLKLISALPISGLDNAQPSGLCWVDGNLYAVSDHHDHTICRLELLEDEAHIEPYITFNAPWSGSWVRGLDFEGLAYRDGSFFIVSEATFRVLRVHETGRGLAWVTPSVKKAGSKVGLFNEKNAGLEGLALLGGGRVVLAAERAQRGLVDVVLDEEGKARVFPLVCATTSLAIESPREVDFSDLFFDGENLYALTRNGDAVVRITFDETDFEEHEIWSFGHVTNAPEYRYEDMTFGKAEGLTMDDEHVYVILDNNGMARASDPTDTRPLLFVFARP